MKIKPIRTRSRAEALELACRVFSEFEDASEAGQRAFRDAIHGQKYLDSLTLLGAYENRKLLGLIATRDEGRHLALFFVEGSHQGQGIGRQLWNAVLEENIAPVITVHSSLYALEIYKKLGFVPTGQIQEEGGIRYVPMEYSAFFNESCPCKRKKCPRHGSCDQCRIHHAKSKHPVACEKE